MARYSRYDWTGSDYDSIRADVVARIQRVFPEWTDHSAANPGMVQGDTVTLIGDLIRYYQDRQANEAFLVTAQERANVIRHLAAIGYAMATAQPAAVTLTFTLSAPQTASVVIDQGERISTEDDTLGYELQARLEIPAGQTTGTVEAIEGLTINEPLGTSDGSASLSFTLGQVPYIFGSEVITVDGIAWARVIDFLSSKASDQSYVITVDAFDQATVTFGDGVNGARAPLNAQVAASYRIGGGSAGNVDVNLIKKLPRSYTTAAGQSVNLSVTNLAAAADGTDRESTDHGKLYGPKSLSTLNRTVASQDYQVNAELVAGVARALAQTSDDDPTIDDNTVLVQIVPVGAGTPTPTLIGLVKTMLKTTKPKPNTTRIMVVPAVYLDLSPVGTVYVLRTQVGQTVLQPRLEQVGDAVLAAYVAFFDPKNIDIAAGKFTIDFGTKVALSKLYATAQGIDGVSYIDLTSPAVDVVVPAKVFPRLRAFVKSIVAGPPIQVVYTWTGTGTRLIVQQEP